MIPLMQQKAQNSSWVASPSFHLYWGIAIAVIGSFGFGIEAAGLARILGEGRSTAANQYGVEAFTAVMFGILATLGIQAILRSVRDLRSGR
jgi:hypothetical protein